MSGTSSTGIRSADDHYCSKVGLIDSRQRAFSRSGLAETVAPHLFCLSRHLALYLCPIISPLQITSVSISTQSCLRKSRTSSYKY